MNPKPIQLRRTLSAQIVDWIAAEIIEERYAPGDHLSENDIAQKLQVSRSPLREALRILEKRGLVTLTPQRGACVTLLSPPEVKNLFEIREMLVGLAGRQLALRCDAPMWDELRPLLARLEVTYESGDEYARASAAATIGIARNSGNLRLFQMIEDFAHQIGRFARLGLATKSRRKQSIRLWRFAFNAIRENDGARAEMMMRQLASENRDAVLQALANRFKPGSSVTINSDDRQLAGTGQKSEVLTS